MLRLKENKNEISPVGMTASFVIKCSLGLQRVRIQIKCCFKLDESIFYLKSIAMGAKLNSFT